METRVISYLYIIRSAVKYGLPTSSPHWQTITSVLAKKVIQLIYTTKG